MKSVIFIAPPSAGKGTQSNALVNYGYIHISTGDMLRDEIKNKTELGQKIENIMSSGSLVSDEIVFELLTNKLFNIDKPFILDGFPRTLNQAEMLDDLLRKLNLTNYEVIYLDLEMEEALKRALGRLTCECGMSYNKFIDEVKPKTENICDKCGKTLSTRTDDNEVSFMNRYKTFLENVEPIKEYYRKINKLSIVDVMIGKDEITERIKEILHD